MVKKPRMVVQQPLSERLRSQAEPIPPHTVTPPPPTPRRPAKPPSAESGFWGGEMKRLTPSPEQELEKWKNTPRPLGKDALSREPKRPSTKRSV